MQPQTPKRWHISTESTHSQNPVATPPHTAGLVSVLPELAPGPGSQELQRVKTDTMTPMVNSHTTVRYMAGDKIHNTHCQPHGQRWASYCCAGSAAQGQEIPLRPAGKQLPVEPRQESNTHGGLRACVQSYVGWLT